MDAFVYHAGLSCLTAQCICYSLYAYILPKGPWTKCPGFTAHQTVCLPLMIYFTYIGFKGWFILVDDQHPSTYSEIVLNDFDPGLHLAQFVLGMLLFWDIPVGFLTPQLQDPIMYAHHICMALVAAIMVGVFSSGTPVAPIYGCFFFGVIELSSIFLTVVDVFHPKQKPWFEYVQGKKTLEALNEFCRVAFAFAFMVLRSIYFPCVD